MTDDGLTVTLDKQEYDALLADLRGQSLYGLQWNFPWTAPRNVRVEQPQKQADAHTPAP